MQKPVTIIAATAGTLALAVALGMCAVHDRRPSAAPAPTEHPKATAAGPVAAAPQPARPAPQPEPTAPKLARPAAPDAGPRLDEAALLAKINELGPSNLPLSLALAREGVARFPGGPNAPEFEMNIAKSLLHLGRLEEARAQARHMVEKYPGNPFTLEVEHHLLRNPPNPPR
jgi:hypothetical protein